MINFNQLIAKFSSYYQEDGKRLFELGAVTTLFFDGSKGYVRVRSDYVTEIEFTFNVNGSMRCSNGSKESIVAALYGLKEYQKISEKDSLETAKSILTYLDENRSDAKSLQIMLLQAEKEFPTLLEKHRNKLLQVFLEYTIPDDTDIYNKRKKLLEQYFPMGDRMLPFYDSLFMDQKIPSFTKVYLLKDAKISVEKVFIEAYEQNPSAYYHIFKVLDFQQFITGSFYAYAYTKVVSKDVFCVSPSLMMLIVSVMAEKVEVDSYVLKNLAYSFPLLAFTLIQKRGEEVTFSVVQPILDNEKRKLKQDKIDEVLLFSLKNCKSANDYLSLRSYVKKEERYKELFNTEIYPALEQHSNFDLNLIRLREGEDVPIKSAVLTGIPISDVIAMYENNHGSAFPVLEKRLITRLNQTLKAQSFSIDMIHILEVMMKRNPQGLKEVIHSPLYQNKEESIPLLSAYRLKLELDSGRKVSSFHVYGGEL